LKPALNSAARLLPALTAGLLAATGSGCQDPFKNIEAVTVTGYMAEALLPADREVGSWRRTGKESEVKTLTGRDFRKAFGQEVLARTRPWGLGESVRAQYRLGETGRTMTVEIYDLNKARGAFDVYGFLREKALGGEKPAARVTKAGVQGLLYKPYVGFEHTGETAPDGRAVVERIYGPRPEALPAVPGQWVLVLWAERFLIAASESGGRADAAEAALLAFGNAITAKLKQPYELPEVYALQVPGEAANSERYEPGRLFRRPELPDGVTARWQGQTGAGTLFISVAESSGEAGRRFEKLRRAANGKLTKTYAEGLFVGSLAGAGPVVCFRWGKALTGLVGAAEAEERMAAVEEIRKRCAGEVVTPAQKPEVQP
jgi:hypothetical protein